jgi:hypothetical protein
MPLDHLGKTLDFPVEVSSQGMLYRGTSDGRIYTSANAGKSWQLHANFGSAYTILGLTEDRSGNVRAQVGFEEHGFELVLMPGTDAWRNL